MEKQRIVCWFSCGCASAVATKMAIDKYKDDKNIELIVAYIYLKNEHSDSQRFLRDCEKWLGYPVTILKDEKYNADVDEVIAKTKYMAGVYGARCTKELKKNVRFNFQKPNDINIFGMTCEEKHRLDRLIDTEPDIFFQSPLIDNNITKKQCFEVLKTANIELPVMYKLGYKNNNCIGCLKAGSVSYWNKIRQDFPHVFNLRASQEKNLNVALCKITTRIFKNEYPVEYARMKNDYKKGLVRWVEDKKGVLRVPLRYLPKTKIIQKELDIGSCGFFCEAES